MQIAKSRSLAKYTLSELSLTSIKDVGYSNISSQGSHLPAPLQQPYVSVHHADTLRQTVCSDVLHACHNLSVIVVFTSAYAVDRQSAKYSFIGKLLYVLLSCHCLAINAGQQQVRGAIMPPMCHSREQR